MNPDETPLVADPKDKGAASTEDKSFTSEDLERALAKQKKGAWFLSWGLGQN